MKNIVNDLKKLVNFKDTIAAGDIVLIAAKNPQMLVYGLICDIVRDEMKREEWYHVSMHILSLPPRRVTWTLRTPQMTGIEIFTMDGEERFMKAVDFGGEIPRAGSERQKGNREKNGLRRVK